MNIRRYLLLIGSLSTISLYTKDIKILVLIIASDNAPVYVELQKIWRQYMHYNPEQVEVYFMKNDPHLPQPTLIEGDVIWSQSPENIYPGLINKTIMSLEALADRLDEFDYVLRANLSSFYIFPRLLEVLQNSPKTNFYFGSSIGNGNTTIGSGCGFIMSLDLVHMLLHNKSSLVNNASAEDDVLIGQFFTHRGISLRMHDRFDSYSISEWLKNKASIGPHVFHFRTKTAEPDRLRNDIYIQKQLLEMFYGKIA